MAIMKNVSEENKIRCSPLALKQTKVGNCLISLTLDTRRECDGKPMPAAIRFTIDRDRYYLRLPDNLPGSSIKIYVRQLVREESLRARLTRNVHMI